MEHSGLFQVLGLVFDGQALDICVVLVRQTVLEEKVGNFELFVDDGDHVGREVVHGAFDVDIRRLQLLVGQELDHPSREFYFILTNRNVETSIGPVILGEKLSSVRQKNLKNFYVSVIGYEVDRLGEGTWELATALGLLVVFVAGKHKFKNFGVAPPRSPLDGTHALRRRDLALNVEVSTITPQLLEYLQIVESDRVENSCDSIVALLLIHIDLLLPCHSFVDSRFQLLVSLIVFQGILPFQ